jgi:superfamily I DNA and/or RNA helicase
METKAASTALEKDNMPKHINTGLSLSLSLWNDNLVNKKVKWLWVMLNVIFVQLIYIIFTWLKTY